MFYKFQINRSPNNQAVGRINYLIRKHLSNLSLLLFILALTNACVVNKKYQYLQKDDVNAKPENIQKDSILRQYPLDDFEYRLQPEDILSVRFFSLTPEEYDFFALKQNSSGRGNQIATAGNALVNGYLIDEDGEIEFPVVGPIKVEGLTIFEAQNHIQSIAAQYLESPIVEVRLLNFRFTLLGEVNKEGVYNSLNNRINILEAIGLSGGFGDLADKSNVKLIRQNGRVAEVFYLDLLDENVLASDFYYVNQLDVIIVPPLKQRPYQVYFGRNLAVIISSVSLLLIVLNLIK